MTQETGIITEQETQEQPMLNVSAVDSENINAAQASPKFLLLCPTCKKPVTEHHKDEYTDDMVHLRKWTPNCSPN